MFCAGCRRRVYMILAVGMKSDCLSGMYVHWASDRRKHRRDLSARSIWLVHFAAWLNKLQTRQNRARPTMVPRRIFMDAYKVHRSYSYGSGCCVLESVGLSVCSVVGWLFRWVWRIVCTRVGPHGYGIVMCDCRAVGISLPDRERLYTRASIMGWTLRTRCNRAIVTLCHTLQISLYSFILLVGWRQLSASNRSSWNMAWS